MWLDLEDEIISDICGVQVYGRHAGKTWTIRHQNNLKHKLVIDVSEPIKTILSFEMDWDLAEETLTELYANTQFMSKIVEFCAEDAPILIIICSCHRPIRQSRRHSFFKRKLVLKPVEPCFGEVNDKAGGLYKLRPSGWCSKASSSWVERKYYLRLLWYEAFDSEVAFLIWRVL